MSDLEKIVALIKSAKEKLEEHLPALKSQVDSIIDYDIKSEKIIETLLDTFLDCILLDVGKNEFFRLLKYYSSFNKENADCYFGFYEEMMYGKKE